MPATTESEPMGRYLHSRGGNGRFRRATLQNTFGLNCVICAECRGFNSYPISEKRPETCCQCGNPLKDLGDKAKENQ